MWHIAICRSGKTDDVAMICRSHVVKQLAAQLRPDLEAQIKKNDAKPGDAYSPDFKSVAKRTLKNKALSMLASLKEPAIIKDLLHRFQSATNMTDRLSALSALNNLEGLYLRYYLVRTTSLPYPWGWDSQLALCRRSPVSHSLLRLLALIPILMLIHKHKTFRFRRYPCGCSTADEVASLDLLSWG